MSLRHFILSIVLAFMVSTSAFSQTLDSQIKIDNSMSKDTVWVMLSDSNNLSSTYGRGMWYSLSALISQIVALSGGGGGISDGDKGDITVSGSGATWNIDANTIGATELSITGVIAGTYSHTLFTVDADGRITSATSGSPQMLQNTSDATSHTQLLTGGGTTSTQYIEGTGINLATGGTTGQGTVTISTTALLPSDTSAMLTNYISRSDTAAMLSPYLREQGYYWIDRHGAIADDGTNDRVAIQALLDYVEGIGGGVVVVPLGVFNVTYNAYNEGLYIGDHTTLLGFGEGSEIRYTGHASVSSTAIQNRRSSGQYSDYQQRVGNVNVHIQGIKLSFTERTDFKNIGISLGGVTWGSVTDTWVDSCGGYSVLIARTNDTDTIGRESSNIVVENLKITNMCDVGLEVWGSQNVDARNIDISGQGTDAGFGHGIFVWNGSKNIRITNATITKDTTDFYVTPRKIVGFAVNGFSLGDTIFGAIHTQGVTFDNCTINADMGFRINNSVIDADPMHRVDSLYIRNCNFQGYDTTTNAAEIRLCKTLFIEGCTFDRFLRHLQFTPTGSTTIQNTVSDVTIRDNSFTWSEGIDFYGITDFNIYDNRFYNIFDQAPITIRGGRNGIIKNNYFFNIGNTFDQWCITLNKLTASLTRETRIIEITGNTACDDRSSKRTDDLVTMYDATDSITVKYNILNCADTDADQYSNLGTGTQIWDETSGSSDHDWYEVGGTSPPNAISDHIFKSSGSVNIGGSSAAAQTLQVTGAARITGSSGLATTLMGRDGDGDVNAVSLGDGLTFEDGALIITGTGADSTFVMGDSICVIDMMGDTICVSQDSTYYTDSTICIIVLGDTTCFNYGTAGLNIYNGNGALTEPRTMTMGANWLSFMNFNNLPTARLYGLIGTSGDWAYFGGSGISATQAQIAVGNSDFGTHSDAMMRFQTTGGSNRQYALGVDRSGANFALAEENDLGADPFMQYYGAGDSLVFVNNKITSGAGVRLRSTTTAAASNTQKLFHVDLRGTNATSSQTTYAGYFSNTHDGTGAQNYGIYATETGTASSSAPGAAIYGLGSFRGVHGSSTSSSSPGSATLVGVIGENTGATGVMGLTTTGTPVIARMTAGGSGISGMLDIQKFQSGSASTGVGASIDFFVESSNASADSTTSLISRWTDKTYATRTNSFTIRGVNSGTGQNQLTLAGSGQLTLNQYTTSNFNGGAAADSVLVITSAGVVKKRNTSAFTGGGGGGVAWGAITGTLSAQTDLQTALDAKVNDTGNETIAGIKTFSSDPIVPAEAYASGWNGSNEVPTKNDVYDKLQLFAAGTGIDHGGLTGLGDDDHTQYSLLAGRSGGQTLKGGTGTTDDLILQSTSGVGATGAEIQMKVGNNGGTRAMTILNTGAIGLSTITSPVSAYLEIPGSQLNSSLKVGAFELQSYTVNNGWVSDNIYYLNGSGFIARSNGFGCMNYFYNGAYQVRVAASSLSAGATFTPKIPLVINRNSSASIGGDVTAGVGHVGAFMMVDSIGKVGIGTSVADKKLEINLGTADAFRLSYNDNNGSAAVYVDETIGSTGIVTLNAVGSGSSFKFEDPILLKGYTVATLPTGVTGMTAYVTDATAPTYLGTLTGGGAVVCPVFYNGTAWVSH